MTNSKLLFSLLLAGTVGTVSAQSLKDARAAIEAENYGKAKTILQKLVSKQPKNGDNYFYLGQIYLVNDRADSAAAIFNQGLTNDPKATINNVGLGYVDLMKKDKAGAESKFALATAKLGKKDYEPLLEIGRAYINTPEPDYAKALEYLTQAKEKNKKDIAIPLALGDAYRGLKEGSLAYTSYGEAMDIDPNSVQAKVGQAVIVRGAQAYDEAVTQLEAVAAETPTYAPTYRELAETYYQWSKAPGTSDEKYVELNKKGVEQYKKYLEVAGDNTLEAKIRYADFLVYARQYDELKTVSEELAKNPDVDPKIYRYLGYIAFQSAKDYPKAMEYLDLMFSKMEKDRVIPLDYMYLGMSQIAANSPKAVAPTAAAGADSTATAVDSATTAVDSAAVATAPAVTPENEANIQKGIANIKKAIEGDKELLAEVAELAFAKYQDQELQTAVSLFELVGQYKDSPYYFDSHYYAGEGNYQIGFKKDSGSKDAEGNYVNQELRNGAIANFEKAQTELTIIETTDNKEAQDKYLINALYYKAFSALGADNLEQPTGDFVAPFQKLIETINQRGTQEKNKAYLIDAYTYIGLFHLIKAENPQAKTNFQKVIELDPANEAVQGYLEALK
ncbi:tetratricopeptide repeat protein [Sphingobacterium sp. N143]|uniref:tetratricopeptide repeat protein n=1 Tax=Sphingobacterium sp. N143 TaxID=2746727 RepID=UPI0025761DB9|nr:tetratricopeptide repeat protein [Sphingobacterium sp. N143]MDM1296755.1 tetratricopeptide repeat protein [Sphingobacterium sp. N143]